MEVDEDADEEGEEAKSDEEGEDTDTEEQNSMAVDKDAQEGEDRPRKQKLKPRKSQINIEAINEEQQALAEYDSKQLAALKVRKKYTKDAINFIHQVELAMDVVVKLLGSKSKAEVLEAIDFFKTAYFFEMNNAQASIFQASQPLHVLTLRSIGWDQEDDSLDLDEG